MGKAAGSVVVVGTIALAIVAVFQLGMAGDDNGKTIVAVPVETPAR
jgi:hypothetical protein